MSLQNNEKKENSGVADFNKIESDILDFWKDNQVFEKSLDQTKEGRPYVFFDGPPFATGLPHYGSILPSVIKDAIPRYQTMKGNYVRRRWGWDCHGLPIENMIEQDLGISGKKQIEDLGVEKFNQACRENVLKYVDEWGKTVRRIARWVDFENSYKTMDTSYMESVWWGLKQMWEKDLIYEDRKVLLYCSRCETPISNFEVAMDNSYKEINEVSVYAKFRLTPRQRIVDSLVDDKTFVLAWTTTPWTLPGNTALNIGSDIQYVMVSQGVEKFILAKERLDVLDGDYTLIKEVSSRSLVGLSYEPLYSEFVNYVGKGEGVIHRILTADFVTTTDGTGVVHNAAMYGEEDYLLAKEKGLPREPMLDHKGHYLPFMGEKLAGKFFKSANRVVLDDLKTRGLVYKEENYLHSYPFCWRCGTQLYYNAIPAWFINIQKIKPDLLKNNEEVNWYPAHLKHGRFKLGIENAPDWNISRNRYWATALPFWKCENLNCGNKVCIGSVSELATKSRNFNTVYSEFDIEAYKLNPSAIEVNKLDLHRPYIDKIILDCESCGSEMRRIPEVVDCWVESGSMPFAEFHYPFENKDQFKQRELADFVVEYIPQTRAWFYVMHVVSSIVFGHAPFKNVMTTGTILAEDGTKMSKSKKNYPDPNLILEKYGADALRFYLLTSPVVLGEDINFSERGVDEVNKKMNLLLYNVWSFFRLLTKEKFSFEELPVSGHVLDVWALERFAQLRASVSMYLDNYDTMKAGKAILEWVNELSTWYVRRSRERFKSDQDEGGLKVYAYLLVSTSKILAPFMPFISEFIYKDISGGQSVHLQEWPEERVFNKEILNSMDVVRELVSLGHSVRKEHKLSVRQPLAAMAFKVREEGINLSDDLVAIILEELNVKSVVEWNDLVNKKAAIQAEDASRVISVILDTEMNEELRLEGLARELERQVQDLRKKSGLKVGDLVDVYYNTTDADLEKVILEYLDRKKTFVNQVKQSLEVEVDFETQAEISSKGIWIGFLKI